MNTKLATQLGVFALPAILACQEVAALTIDFNYTGGAQTFVTPTGVSSINVQAWGGQGNRNASNQGVGGRGGYAAGDLAVTTGDTLQINIGGGGNSGASGNFLGGANGGSAPGLADGGGGGGASDVRMGGTSLSNRVVVAGGGGGAGGNRIAGVSPGAGGGGGGGYYGGGGGGAYRGIGGGGGTQVAGGAGGATNFPSYGGGSGANGSLGSGGSGGVQSVGNNQGGSNTGADGGGAGLDGANSSSSNWEGAGGGGGSSYIGGLTNGATSTNVNLGQGLVTFIYNLPELFASPASGSFIDFGELDFGTSSELTDFVSIANIGLEGTFIDILGASFAGDSGFSLTGGDVNANLLGNGTGGTAELFSLGFDTTGLMAGTYSSALTFDTSLGSVVYNLQGVVSAEAPAPATFALLGIGLAGLGWTRRRKA